MLLNTGKVEQIDLTAPFQLLVFSLVVFVVIFIRYLIVAGGYHYLLYSLVRKRIAHRILDRRPWPKKQFAREIYWSTGSALVFTVFGVGLFALWRNGYTAIYASLDAYPLWYFFGSIFLALFIQDAYYYWLHRWMHRPGVYKYLHKVHHNSVHTSVFTSFSFHPAETVLQALILPLIIVVLPLHVYAILILLTLMTLSAVINHAGVEVYPSGKLGHGLSSWLIGATHHDQHHRKFTVNYGLYFTFWDRWMGTEAPARRIQQADRERE
jgi:sterol desaturase/sphingolipid hydroxylase (fatty acid hydroxylase superfamily)